jgi:hypothetical protein
MKAAAGTSAAIAAARVPLRTARAPVLIEFRFILILVLCWYRSGSGPAKVPQAASSDAANCRVIRLGRRRELLVIYEPFEPAGA